MGYYLDLISEADPREYAHRPPRLDTLLRRAGAVRHPEGTKREWLLQDDRGVYGILFVATDRGGGRLGSVRLSWGAGEREIEALINFAEKLHAKVCDTDTGTYLSHSTKDQFLTELHNGEERLGKLGF